MISVQTVLLVFVLILFLLAFAAGIGIFFFYLLKNVRDLNNSLRQSVEVLKAMNEGVGFADVLKTVEHSCKVAIELGRTAEQVTGTLRMIHKAMFNKDAAVGVPGFEAAAEAPPESSAWFPSSDADQARKEFIREAAKRGIKVGVEEQSPAEEEVVVDSAEQP